MDNGLLHSFVTLLVILDPFGGIPVFLLLTREYDTRRTRKAANRAIRVSLILLLVFLFAGGYILKFFGISIFSFQIAGGLILLVLGVAYTLDINLYGELDYSRDIIVPMATPLIAGPGAITAIIILVHHYGYLMPLAAVLLNLFIFWLAMYNATYIKRYIGRQGVSILSRIMGLLLVALSVEMMREAFFKLK
ncbi:MAG: MarC family protein [FCB group bacterium]|nr:MarC family protein [FCB group bacterium]